MRCGIKRRGKQKGRSGFTLVELLVVIAIIGMLMAMALPALNMARETARRNDCGNKMVQLSKALFQYELSKKQYPGYLNTLLRDDGKPYTNQQTGQAQGVSWVIPLLSSLDNRNLDRAYRSVPGGGSGSGGGAGGGGGNQSGGGANNQMMNNVMIRLDILLCPSNMPTEQGTQIAYVANTGMQDQPSGQSGGGGGSGGGGAGGGGGQQNQSSLPPPRDAAGNGVFFDLYSDRPDPNKPATRRQTIMSSSFITRGDGMSQTILLTENADAGNYTGFTEQELGCIWTAGSVDTSNTPPTADPTKDEMRINRGHDTGQAKLSNFQSYDYVRPSSFHPGGVNVVYCDTHLQFISQDINYYVYCLLMSSNGRQVTQPGQTQILPNYSIPLDMSWVPEG